jgi:CRP-like cAMP-binding protein
MLSENKDICTATFALMDNQTLHSHIAKVSILSDEDIALLTSCVVGRNLKKGEPILKEGEVCRSFYLVDKGYLRTYYNKEGIPINLNFTFEGEFTTNFKSYKGKQASELIIEAGEDASVWVFNIKLLSERLNPHSQIAKFVRRLAINMLLASEAHSDLFKIYTPTERYRYIEKNNPKLLQRISLSQMASYLGIARETLSRIRAKKL